MTTRLIPLCGIVLALASSVLLAQTGAPPADRSGKLLLTGGVSQIEGAAGGGLTPWAVIAGYGTADQIGANAFYTRVNVDEYHLDAHGVAVGFYDRFELSLARQRFNTEQVGAALGLGRGFELEQQIIGLKLRLLGDAVLDQDRWWPQLSLGVQHKSNDQGDLLRAIGADSDSGTDYYLAASKLYLAQSLLLNATLRWTRANQTGLLGFGGDRGGSRSLETELSAAWLLSRRLAIGAEYRTKPDNLAIAREDDWWDLYLAYAPSKHLSVTLAWVDLGNIVIADNQRGYYLSVQAAF
jgi:hypothetical protein